MIFIQLRIAAADFQEALVSFMNVASKKCGDVRSVICAPVLLLTSLEVVSCCQRHLSTFFPLLTCFYQVPYTRSSNHWDLIQRLKSYKLFGHRGCVNTLNFNASGDILVSGSDDRNIVFWDWNAKRQKFAFNSGHEGNVFQAKLMPFSDDKSVISCAADGQVRHSQVLEGGVVESKKLGKHWGPAHKLAIEPGSPRTFFSCGEDGVVKHFDLREAKHSKLLTCHSYEEENRPRHLPIVRLNAIDINPRNPNYFAVGGSDECARVYDLRKIDADASTGKDQPVNYFVPAHLMGTSHYVHITSLVFSQKQELLVSYNNENIYLFQKDAGLGACPMSKEKACLSDSDPQAYQGHRNVQTVKGVNFFGPSSEYVVSGSDCGNLFIWKKSGGKLLALMKGDSRVVNCLEPHPHATILATSGYDKTVRIWTPIAPELQSLPADAEKIMETNRRKREGCTHVSLTPEIVMRVLHLQRRHTQSEWEHYLHVNDHNDEDPGDDSDDASSEDSHGSARECIIS